METSRELERGLSGLIRRMRRGKLEEPHNWAYLVTDPPERRFYVALYPYAGIRRDERNAVLRDILSQPEAQESRGAVCVGIDLDCPEVPYTVVVNRRSPDLFDALPQNSRAS